MSMDLETWIGRELRVGSVVSTALLAIGVVVYIAFASRVGWALIHAGLLIVLVTPVARVLVSMAGFVQQRDWRFVLMTAAVLGVLAASVVAAFR